MKSVTAAASPSFSSAISVPGRNESAREDADATVVKAQLDNDAYLRALWFGATSTRIIPIPMTLFSQNLVTKWRCVGAGIQFLIQSDADTETCIADITAFLPCGGHITDITAAIKGPGGHGSLPAVMPSLVLTKCDIAAYNSAPTITTVATAADTSATIGAYEAEHTLGATGIGEVCDPLSYRYNLVITGESGANSVDGLSIWRVSVTLTT